MPCAFSALPCVVSITDNFFRAEIARNPREKAKQCDREKVHGLAAIGTGGLEVSGPTGTSDLFIPIPVHVAKTRLEGSVDSAQPSQTGAMFWPDATAFEPDCASSSRPAARAAARAPRALPNGVAVLTSLHGRRRDLRRAAGHRAETTERAANHHQPSENAVARAVRSSRANCSSVSSGPGRSRITMLSIDRWPSGPVPRIDHVLFAGVLSSRRSHEESCPAAGAAASSA